MPRFEVRERTVFDVVDTTGEMGEDGLAFSANTREEADVLCADHERSFGDDQEEDAWSTRS